MQNGGSNGNGLPPLPNSGSEDGQHPLKKPEQQHETISSPLHGASSAAQSSNNNGTRTPPPPGSLPPLPGNLTPPPGARTPTMPILRPPSVTAQSRNTSLPSSISPKPPSYQNRHARHVSNLSVGSAFSAGSPFTQTANKTPQKPIELVDVLSTGAPHELEAETHILRALEKINNRQTQQMPSSPQTETERLYGQVAHDEMASKATETDAGSEVGSVHTKTKPAAGVGRSRFRDMVQKTMDDMHAAKSKPTTVEETLFGLTNVLSAMEDHSIRSKSMKKMRSVRNDISIAEEDHFEPQLQSVDKLANTVGEVLQEDRKADVEEGGLGIRKSTHQPDAIVEGDDEDYDSEDEFAHENDDTARLSDTGQSTSGSENGGDNRSPTKKKRKKKNKRLKKSVQLVSGMSDELKADASLFSEFIGGRKQSMLSYAKTVLFFVFIPAASLAALLYYAVEEFDRDEMGKVIPGQDASVSYWILFLGVRQVVTLTMALLTQMLVIDWLALGSRFALRWFGPMVTLLVVESKGWPFISTFWGAYNLILLAGDARWIRHWAYWQQVIDLFNEQNPGGTVTNSSANFTIMRLMVGIGVVTAIKRLFVGLFLGRQTFAHFGKELASVMKNMVLVGEVATLAKEIEKDRRYYQISSTANQSTASALGMNFWEPNTISDFVNKEADAVMEEEAIEAKDRASNVTAFDAAATFINKRKTSMVPKSITSSAATLAVNNNITEASSKALGDLTIPPELSQHSKSADDAIVHPAAQEFTESERVDILELLDEWEEPTRAEESEERKITIGAVMQFRQALNFMKRKYPFLPAFGPADTRERCIESSQSVYDRLMLRTPHLDVLPFETLALLAKDDKGGMNLIKAKELIKAFRPERDGSLGKLEFVKSVDAIYKQLRLLSANIANSSQIDKAVETVINVVYYIAVGCCALAAIGQDPRTVFFSISSVVLGFAFMFGGSAAKYFEGVMFILIQRPYGVGDRIHLSNPQNETSPEGSSGWIVERVTLSTTTVYWGTTNERATLNNGAISNLRVINAARSPNATVFVELKFGMDTPYEKIAIFRTAVEEFLKDRPREWLTFIGFRPTEVAVEKGYIGYKVIAQHRNHWQGVGAILESKAALTTYCLEVARQLEMRYHAPPLPVNMSMGGDAASALRKIHHVGRGSEDDLDRTQIANALKANSAISNRKGTHQAFGED